MALTPWLPEVFAIFRKKIYSPSFLPCSSIFFPRCSVKIFFSLAMAWLLISALSLGYFSFFCNILWISVGEISLSCITCEMVSAMLSNLPWASSLMVSCFSQGTIEALRYFRVARVIRENSRLASPEENSTCSPAPLASAAMDIPQLGTADVIRLVSAMLNIVMDRLTFFIFYSNFSISWRKNASISDNLFNRYG